MLIVIKLYIDSLQLILLPEIIGYVLLKLKKVFLKWRTCNDLSLSEEFHSQSVIGKKNAGNGDY